MAAPRDDLDSPMVRENEPTMKFGGGLLPKDTMADTPGSFNRAGESSEGRGEANHTGGGGGGAEGPKFGTGLLPADSVAESRPPWISIKTRLVDVNLGPVYMSIGSQALGAGFSLGLDLSMKELSNPLFYRAILMEFFATFLFLFFTLSTVVWRAYFMEEDDLKQGAANHLMVALVFGFMIFLMVYMAAPISGGHINPAVSVGLAITRKVTFIRMLFYIAAQVAGAVAGAFTVRSLNKGIYEEMGGGANALAEPFTESATYGAEIMGTGLLMVIVAATVDPIRSGDVIHISTLGPFAIGMAVFMAHLALIPIDGCSINPARSFGAAAAMGSFKHQGIFWGGPIAGAIVGSMIYEIFFKARKEFEQRHQD